MEDFSYKPTVILCTLEVHLRAAAKVFFFSQCVTDCVIRLLATLARTHAQATVIRELQGC